MAPIFRLFDLIFSSYFNKFLDYDYIQKLQLPLWIYSLVGVFVLAIVLWTILVVRGLKDCILQLIKKSKCLKDAMSGATICDTSDHSGVHIKPIWVHIKPRRPTHHNQNMEHDISTRTSTQQSVISQRQRDT